MLNSNIETLFREHYQALHRYAFTMVKNADEANDIVQNVFFTLLEKDSQLSFHSSAKAYLYKCVYNEALQQIKKKKTAHLHHNAAYNTEQSEAPQVFAFEETVAIKNRIDTILQQLPEQCRLVFLKSRQEHKKYAEIAIELNISVKTVEAHMSKALKIIRGIVRVFVCLFYLSIDFTGRL